MVSLRRLAEVRRRLTDARPAFTEGEVEDLLDRFHALEVAFEGRYPGKSFFSIDYAIGKLSSKYVPPVYPNVHRLWSEAKRQQCDAMWEALWRCPTRARRGAPGA